MASGGWPDPEEVFKSESGDDDDSYTPSKCSDEFCDKRSWCDGNHSYSMETLKSRHWGIFADLPSDDSRWLSRPPTYRDDDDVTSKLKPNVSPEKKPISTPKKSPLKPQKSTLCSPNKSPKKSEKKEKEGDGGELICCFPREKGKKDGFDDDGGEENDNFKDGSELMTWLRMIRVTFQ